MEPDHPWLAFVLACLTLVGIGAVTGLAMAAALLTLWRF